MSNITIDATAGGSIGGGGVAYYVSPTGNDSANGLSPATAWKTIAKVNASIFLPGEAILFQGGQTFSGAIVSPSAGTPAAPITFGSYGGGQATISSGTSNGFTSTNQAGIIVRDLTFTGSASTNHGILFQNTLGTGVHLQNIQAINCNVSGYGRNGIFATGSASGSGYDDILFQGCTVNGCCTVAFSGNGTAGVIVYNVASFGLGSNPVSFNNVIIENCISHDNTGTTDTNWTGSGIITGQTNQGIIRDCVAYNNGASCNSSANNGVAGIWCVDSTNILIESCTSHNNSSATIYDGDGFDIDEGCINCTIRDCYSHDNFGLGFGIYSGTDTGVTGNDRCSIINCTTENDGGGASSATPTSISLFANNTTSTNWRVSGCRAYQSHASTDIVAISGAHATAITGLVDANRFIVTGSQLFVNTAVNVSSVTFAGNDYISEGAFNVTWNSVAYTSLGAWKAATAQETNSVVSLISVLIPTGGLNLIGSTPGINLQDTETHGNTWEWFVALNGTTSYSGFYIANSPDQTPMAINYDGLHGFQIQSGAVFGWSSDARYADAAAMDTGISRTGAAAIAFGNGTPGDTSAILHGHVVIIDGSYVGFAIELVGGFILPAADSTSAIMITNAAASHTIFNVDSTNNRVGINKVPGAFDLDVSGTANAAGFAAGGTAGISATITTAKVTPVTGANGSMTFVNGILTAQTQAT